MTLSPLVVLILLLFLMLTAVLFLMWSLFTLRAAQPNSKTTKEAPLKRQQSKTRAPKLDSKTELKRRLNNNLTRGLNASTNVAASIPVATPTPVEAKVTKTHKPTTPTSEQLKPQKPLVPVSFEEKLEPLLLDEPVAFDKPAVLPSPPSSTPKFTLINADDETILEKVPNVTKKSEASEFAEPEQIPLFDEVATATFKPKATVTKTQTPAAQSNTYEEDAFDRFIKSKNDDLDF